MKIIYLCNSSILYCLILLFIGSLELNNAAFILPSSNVAATPSLLLSQHSTTLFMPKQTTKTTSLLQLHKHEYSTERRFNNGDDDNKNNNNNTYRPTKKRRRKKNNTRRNMNYKKHSALQRQVIKCNDAFELLTLLENHSDFALSKISGDGAFDNVNFATIFYRFAKLVSNHKQHQDQKNRVRSQILSDPRFALLVCCTVEALSNQGSKKNSVTFDTRQLANIVWSIAKLQIAPPKEAYPLKVSSMAFSNNNAVQQCAELRNQIYQIAEDRLDNVSDQIVTASVAQWIPDLSKLCGLLVDMISYKASQVEDPNEFQLQHCANMLWAVTTIQRCNSDMITNVVNKMVQLAETHIEPETNNMEIEYESRQEEIDLRVKEMNPQHFSISLWSLATSRTFGPDEQLIHLIATLMVSYPSFLYDAKSQELSNIAWSTATILSNRPFSLSERLEIAALTIMKCISKEIIERQGARFNSQDIINTVQALENVIELGLVSSTTNNKQNNNDDSDYVVMSDAIKILLERKNKM